MSSTAQRPRSTDGAPSQGIAFGRRQREPCAPKEARPFVPDVHERSVHLLIRRALSILLRGGANGCDDGVGSSQSGRLLAALVEAVAEEHPRQRGGWGT